MFQTVMTKLKSLFTSIRFWIVTLGLITALLDQVASGGLTLAYVFDALQVYIATVVGIGTLDSVATGLSGTKNLH